MKTATLLCHPATADQGVYILDVTVTALSCGDIQLQYCLTGDLEQILLPPPMTPTATEGLWEHTCFEAFIAIAGEKRYHEFNFSPSGQWAAFAFCDIRERSQWTTRQIPVIAFERNAKSMLLEALIPAIALPPNALGKSLQLGISCVLETRDGNLSYWALHHPGPCPDFHNRAGFTLFLKHP